MRERRLEASARCGYHVFDSKLEIQLRQAESNSDFGSTGRAELHTMMIGVSCLAAMAYLACAGTRATLQRACSSAFGRLELAVE